MLNLLCKNFRFLYIFLAFKMQLKFVQLLPFKPNQFLTANSFKKGQNGGIWLSKRLATLVGSCAGYFLCQINLNMTAKQLFFEFDGKLPDKYFGL